MAPLVPNAPDTTNAPKPHDARRPKVDAEELERGVGNLLSAPAETLEEEALLLERAHELLQQALQDRPGKT